MTTTPAPASGPPMTAMPPAPRAGRLTAGEQYVIAQARELAALDHDPIRGRVEAALGSGAGANPYPYVWGEARYLLAELAAIAERLGAS